MPTPQIDLLNTAQTVLSDKATVRTAAAVATVQAAVAGWRWALLVVDVDILTGTNPTVDLAFRQGILVDGAFVGVAFTPWAVKDEAESAIAQFTVDAKAMRLIKIVGTHLEMDITVGGTVSPTAKVGAYLLFRDDNFLGAR